MVNIENKWAPKSLFLIIDIEARFQIMTYYILLLYNKMVFYIGMKILPRPSPFRPMWVFPPCKGDGTRMERDLSAAPRVGRGWV